MNNAASTGSKRVHPEDEDALDTTPEPKRAKRNSGEQTTKKLRESDMLPDSLVVLKTARVIYRSKISTEWPYPDSRTEIAFAKVAWKAACEDTDSYFEYDVTIAKNVCPNVLVC